MDDTVSNPSQPEMPSQRRRLTGLSYRAATAVTAFGLMAGGAAGGFVVAHAAATPTASPSSSPSTGTGGTGTGGTGSNGSNATAPAGGFHSNEDPKHEAAESPEREAAENNGTAQFPPPANGPSGTDSG